MSRYHIWIAKLSSAVENCTSVTFHSASAWTKVGLNNSSPVFTLTLGRQFFAAKFENFFPVQRRTLGRHMPQGRKVEIWFAFYINFRVIYFSSVWIGLHIRVNRVKGKMTFFTCFKSGLHERVCILLEIWILRPSYFHICLNIYQALNMLGLMLWRELRYIIFSHSLKVKLLSSFSKWENGYLREHLM